VEECAECGYSYSTFRRHELAPALVAGAQEYRAVLVDTDPGVLRAHLRVRVWSALEYACHVRDVLEVQQARVVRALTEERPDFASMRRDERVTEDRYNEQDPRLVADQLLKNATTLSQTFDRIDDAGWGRTGVYHWPTTQVRTVEWIGRHTVHEQVHHLLDVHRHLGL
jgi:hypothetical protein